jgi:SpoU rRNA methylase family enzyme
MANSVFGTGAKLIASVMATRGGAASGVSAVKKIALAATLKSEPQT